MSSSTSNAAAAPAAASGAKLPAPQATLRVLTWNIAAINNNPFEYWIHHTDPKYNQLMLAVADFVSNPGERDVPVEKVFTSSMFARLQARMAALGWEGVEETAKLFAEDFSKRPIISGFLKDTSLGKKRLASWPDRLTNTISVSVAASGGAADEGNSGSTESRILCRPTVINCFDKALPSQEAWYTEWEAFMFEAQINAKGQRPVDVMSRIRKSKYPALTQEEERISLPLQTLCLAIFDAIQVHMMNASGIPDWLRIKRGIMEKMNLGKVARTVEICQSYARADVLCLQECGRGFLEGIKSSKLAETHHVVASASADPNRDQNSLLLLRKSLFGSEITEHSEAAFAAFPDGANVPVAPGDLLVVTAPLLCDSGRPCLVASFHGDTNGLASVPVLRAVHAAAASIDHASFIFGMDANVYEIPQKGLATFDEFVGVTNELGYDTTWGPGLRSDNYTTFNARTYVMLLRFVFLA